MKVFSAPPPPEETRLTKRAFWNRFPVANERAMRAIMAQGAPALLAGVFAQLQSRVDSSPWVDVTLAQTIQGVSELASNGIPETVVIDGVTLPLRLTGPQAAAILQPPKGDEAFTE